MWVSCECDGVSYCDCDSEGCVPVVRGASLERSQFEGLKCAGANAINNPIHMYHI